LHSVQQVFRRVLEDLLPLAEAKNIDLGVENDLDAQVLAYEVDLVTLVKNLVDNAIRYTPPGGRIDLAVQPGPGLVEVWIRDTGPGIPLVEQGRVFDPFYRVLGHDSTGSGLGLSIVQAIAERMGAQVQLGYADGLAQTGLAVQVVLHRSLLKT
jgi:two-component system OmpR family sensor kinase